MGLGQDWKKYGRKHQTWHLGTERCVPAALGHFLQNLAQNRGLQCWPFPPLSQEHDNLLLLLEHFVNVHVTAL